MKERTTGSLLRSVALLGAVAASATAFGDYVWKAEESGNWSDSKNWTGDNGNYVFTWETATPTVNFTEMSNVNVGIWVENADGTMTFAAESTEKGLNQTAGDMHIGGTNHGYLNITGGSYTFPNVYLSYSKAHWYDGTYGELTVSGGELIATDNLVLGYYENSNSKLTINGGYVKAGAVTGNGVGTLVLNGGTLSATSVSGVTLEVGANGGTFDNANDATISAALAGSGTLTKTGAGTLFISGDLSGFTGKIVCSEGVVYFGENDDADVERISAGQEKSFAPPTYITTWFENFESVSALGGWTYEGVDCEASVSTRKLADGSASKFYRLYLAKSSKNNISATARYAMAFEPADVYSFELDFFPKVSYNNENTLTITGKRTVGEENETVTLAKFVTQDSNQGNGGSKTKVHVWVGDNDIKQLSIESRNTATATAAENSSLWYHIIISGSEGKTYLSVLDRSGNTVVEKIEVGDFAMVSELALNIRTSTAGDAVLGLDNFVLKTLQAEGAPADPEFAVTPVSFAGDRTVVLSCDDATATIYYRDATMAEFVEYTEAFTVPSSRMVYAYAQNEAGKSDIVSQQVYAHIALNAPSIARRGRYAVLVTAGADPITGEKPACTIHYNLKGDGEATTTSSPYYARSQHSSSFDVDGTTVFAWVSADNYVNSATVRYTGYSFSSDYKSIYNTDFAEYSRLNKDSTVWYDDDGQQEYGNTTYRGIRQNNRNHLYHSANVWFSNTSNGDSPRWRINQGTNGLNLQTLDGSILFKGVKLGTLVYVNADSPKNPVNLTKLDGYTNADEYVYEVTGTPDVETGLVDATLTFPGNSFIYCIKVYEPKDKIAQVGDVQYTSLADAIEAANGATITLLQATEEGFTLAADQTVTINHTENNYGAGTISVPEGYTLKSEEVADADYTYAYSCEVQQSEPAVTVEPGQAQVVADETAAYAVEMGVPAAVSGALTTGQVATYTACFERKVTEVDGGFSVSFELKETVEDEIQAAVDGVFVGKGENVVDVSALASATEATKVTVTVAAVPGLYYGVTYGDGLGGSNVWTTDAKMATGDTVEITFPAASETGTQFYQVIVSPTDPATATVADPAEGEAGNGDDQA